MTFLEIAGVVFSILLLGIVVFLGVVLYMKFSSPMCQSKARLDGETVVVTGANTGIGKIAAEDLAKRGARVILACRNVNKGREAADDIISRLDNGRNVKVMEVDLSSLTSVRKFVEKFLKEEDRLDILLNNAGCGWLPERVITKDGLELTMASNHYGHFLLTNLLLDRLKSCAPSRVVNVSSVAHKWGKIDFDDLAYEKSYQRLKVYPDSKLANIYFTKELAKRLKGTGVTANTLHPGTINSDFGRHAGLTKLPGVAGFSQLFLKTTVQGAQTSIYCCVAEELETVSGKYFSDCKEKKCSGEAYDEDAAETLWDVSETLVGLK
ncbi:retinol dehydrogenase 12-like [Lineus longissimus]|uniref:retinol dehydrogenase 12-like n=1 Tax=Lineus longissimus TaxID=88925 RepID=UPI002B4F220E